MARRGMTGQLNMFDFFKGLDARGMQSGEVEMVSLIPREEEQLPEEKPEEVQLPEEKPEETQLPEEKPEETQLPEEQPKKMQIPEEQPKEIPMPQNEQAELIPKNNVNKKVVTKKITEETPVMSRSYDTKAGTLQIAYLNYNKVSIQRDGKPAEIKVFESSKEAVDFYVEQMQTLQELYGE